MRFSLASDDKMMQCWPWAKKPEKFSFLCSASRIYPVIWTCCCTKNNKQCVSVRFCITSNRFVFLLVRLNRRLSKIDQYLLRFNADPTKFGGGGAIFYPLRGLFPKKKKKIKNFRKYCYLFSSFPCGLTSSAGIINEIWRRGERNSVFTFIFS